MPIEDRRGEEDDPLRRFYGRMRRGVQVYGKLFEQPNELGDDYEKDIEKSVKEIKLRSAMEELERRNAKSDETAGARKALERKKK